jgi:hypothetical protein
MYGLVSAVTQGHKLGGRTTRGADLIDSYDDYNQIPCRSE